MPIVSVIIPTYNRVDLLRKAIDSVLNQTYKDFELIIVDDGSTDNTKEIISKYGDKIIYFYKENGGNSDARNYGICRASGKYIAFLDHDDMWYPERLEKLIELMEKNQQYSAIISEVEFIDINCWTLRYSNYKAIFPDNGEALQYMLSNLLGLFSNLIVRKEVISKIGFLDENMKAASDIDYYIRISVDHKIALYDKPLLKYRKTDTSLSNKVFTKNRLNVLSKFRKEHPDLAKKYARVLRNTVAKVHLSYADDLLWARYITEARKELLESLRSCLTFKAAKLFIKSAAMEISSLLLPEYENKRNFKHEKLF